MKTLFVAHKLGLACLALTILTACNGGGGGDTPSPTIVQDNSSAQTDTRPTANAGPDQNVNEGTLVTLDGRNSFDADGDPIIFQWRQISGPAVQLSSENDETPSFIAPSGTVWLTFQLIIDDGKNLSIGDTVTINVQALPEPEPEPEPEQNNPVVVIPATPEETTTEETPAEETNTPAPSEPENTNSDSSTDNSTDSASEEAESTTPDTETPATDETNTSSEAEPTSNTDETAPETETTEETATPTEEETTGTEPTEEQAVAENDAEEETDPLVEPETETEPPVSNTPPIANAGVDRNVQGFSLVLLDGSLSTDPENTNLTYNWQQVSGSAVNLNNSTIATPNFDAPNINDTLVFSLRVNDGELSSEADEVSITIQQVNTAPIAHAGIDQTVEGLSQIQLNGGMSSDPEGDSLSYSWQQVSGTEVVLDNENSLSPSFSAPNIDATLVFSLSVNDGDLSSVEDSVNISIHAINQVPIAAAGDDQTVFGFTQVNLSGLNSQDPDGDTLSFNWTQVSGTAVTLNDPQSQAASFIAPNVNDTLIFSLSVNDGTVDSVADTLSIHIQKVNTPPVAHAGVNRYVGSLSVVALNGSASQDEDGDTLTFQWTQLSGPAVSLNQSNSAQPTFTADTDGELIFSLMVNDGQSDSTADTVKVVVGPIPASNIKVNGTGITWGGNFPSGNNTGCVGELIDQQDCFSGREITHNDNSDGRVGFTFVKYDANGVELDGSAAEWQCVEDQVTGLMWEIKTGGNAVIGDEGINDADDRYSWYNSDPATNGGASGALNNQPEACYGYDAEDPTSYCNSQAFVARMNEVAWCGFADWRMPTRKEMLSLVDYGNAKPMIDSSYFPASGTFVWTGTPLALGNTSAWGVNFDYGNSFSISKQNARQLRLVRGGYE